MLQLPDGDPADVPKLPEPARVKDIPSTPQNSQTDDVPPTSQNSEANDNSSAAKNTQANGIPPAPQNLQTDDIPPTARDLLHGLLYQDPSRRIRSLHQFQRQSFYHRFPFDDLYSFKVKDSE